MTRNFTLEYWIDDKWYVGQLRKMPNVLSQGATFAELEENIRDAYRLMNDESHESDRDLTFTAYRKGSGSGQKYRELIHIGKRLEDHGLSLLGIKAWREKEMAAGRPSGLEDFYRIHGVCAACRCTGLQMTGWDEQDQVPLWTICSACGGSGRTT